MSIRLTELPWLCAEPPDWGRQCSDLLETGHETPCGARLRSLASVRLDSQKSRKLATIAGRLRSEGRDLAPLSEFRLGVVATHTFNIVSDCLQAAALRHSVFLETFIGPYGVVMQELLDGASFIYSQDLDALLISMDHRSLGLDVAADFTDGSTSLSNAIATTRQILDTLMYHGGPPAILQTIPLPLTSLFGSYDAAVTGSMTSLIQHYNFELPAIARQYGGYVLDVAALAGHVGSANWFNPKQWAAFKLPFDAMNAPIYADWLGRLLGAIRGKSAKCLVMDLDNTLWGGVVGDDGVEGIVIGHGSAVGEAHLALQAVARKLRSRGIYLAVASKNDMPNALAPFRKHADMLLREHDISVFQANWSDKASNLESIAKSLNIGLDSLAFLDDNPAERQQVRDSLPEVRVLELPDDPSGFSETLEACGYFEAVTYSHEDTKRVDMRAEEGQRSIAAAQSRDLHDYLRKLGMELEASRFDSVSRERIVQLINKTNQFNLTTRRYTEAEVRAVEADASGIGLQFRLRDRFGDMGTICVVICSVMSDDLTWHIDAWLMSCRVLGRDVERAVLVAIVRKAEEYGIMKLVGTFTPTERNSIVSDHYRKLGFREMHGSADTGTQWMLDIREYLEPSVEMRLVIK